MRRGIVVYDVSYSLVVVESQLWYRLYDTTTIRLRRSRAPVSIRREQKINMSIFRRSLVVVVSQSNRNFDHFRRSRMRRGIVLS